MKSELTHIRIVDAGMISNERLTEQTESANIVTNVLNPKTDEFSVI